MPTESPTSHTVRTPRMAQALTEYLGLLGVLVALILFFGIFTKNFLTLDMAALVANQNADLMVIAAGMTFVLIIAGIDLSVGSVLGLSSVVLGISMLQWGLPWWLGIPLCLVAGLLCGLFNGAISVKWTIHSFVVTLGMMGIARGLAAILSDSRTMHIGAPLRPIVTSLPYVRVSIAFLIALAVVLLGEFVLRRTVFGRYAIAIGGNEEAARLSGIRTGRVKLAVFAISGFLAALAGVFQTSLLETANPEAGIGMELSAIAAVVIGGTSLMGGRGSVFSSFLGVLIIAVLQSGLAQIGAKETHKPVITGCAIIVAVIVDAYRNRLRGGA